MGLKRVTGIPGNGQMTAAASPTADQETKKPAEIQRVGMRWLPKPCALLETRPPARRLRVNLGHTPVHGRSEPSLLRVEINGHAEHLLVSDCAQRKFGSPAFLTMRTGDEEEHVPCQRGISLGVVGDG